MSEVTPNSTECPASDILKEGRRHFICKEYAQAVEKLSEACEKLVEKHGEGNIVLADAFYSYGEALLEMARMETPVLGNALKDVPDVIAEGEEKEEQAEENDGSIDEKTKEEIADKVIDALCEAPVVDANNSNVDSKTVDETDDDTKQVEKTDETVDCSEDDNKVNDKNEKEDTEMRDSDTTADETVATDKNESDGNGEATTGEDENAEEDIESEADEENEGEENEGNAADQEENEVGYLQLAWEIIEVARTLFSKKLESDLDKDMHSKTELRIADCHRKLGEVLMERDEWTQAAEELQKCLELENKHMNHPNRRVAETNFEIGVAFDNAEKIDESAAAFQRSVTILEDFQKKLASNEEKSSDDEAEIKELESVLEEIRTRIIEVKQKIGKPQVSDDQAASSSNGGTVSEVDSTTGTTTVGFCDDSAKTNGFNHSSENGDSVKETQDITHLIRKRPKGTEAADSPVKKVRVDTNGCEN